MWDYSLIKIHGLLVLIYIIVHIESLTSSTGDCSGCPKDYIQNLQQCSKQTDCEVVCKDGYWGDKCQFGRIRLTSSKGYITDGAKSYTSLSKRMWLIETGNRINATIHFQIKEFSTECNWDHLYIFDGDSTDSHILAAFNGLLLADVNSTGFVKIPQEIIAKSGKAYIYFYSDSAVVKSGFNISYSILDSCPCINGKCNTAGLCLCDNGWSGTLCDVKENCSSSCINGVCNETLGNCVCNDGFTGNDCGQPVTFSYWTSVNTGTSDVEISPRSSHASAMIGDEMWVYNGYRFPVTQHRQYRHLHRYNVKTKIWRTLPIEEDSFIWGHSMVAYQNKLIVFGGKQNEKILNKLSMFDTNSSNWSHPFVSAVAVTGHTATIVEDKMIVIFGLSTNGLYHGIQQYDIGKSKWEVIKTRPAYGTGRFGHSSVYDPLSKKIFVYGGFMLQSRVNTSDSLMAYEPHSRKWTTLASSKFHQALHSAVLLDRMMLVFGGNPDIQRDNECHTTKLHVYDLACQKWHSEDVSQLTRTLARYGHTAVSKERTMYLFGGFNGALFNDVLTYTHGECVKIRNQSECMGKYFSSGCYWNNSHCVNKDSLETLPQCPVKHRRVCSAIKSCDECNATAYCGWANQTCRVNGSETCPTVVTVDVCPLYPNCKSCKIAGCYWQTNKCQKQRPKLETACREPCSERNSHALCIPDNDRTCLWCENLQRCFDHKLYVVHYPYGQCFEWTDSNKAVSCESKSTCNDCLTHPSCGWYESPARNGAGHCLTGGLTGPKNPKDVSKYKHWIFFPFDCPLCQCNGHSNCLVNSSECLRCQDHTSDKNCNKCVDGYFGNALNGGTCQPCQCNGHADTCDHVTGVCKCNMKGVRGPNCESCLSNPYVGNSTNGGFCYYQLTPDYLYRINVSDKTMFNFICSPNESDKDTIVTVEVSKGNRSNPATLNISVGSDIMAEQYLLTYIELSSKYEERFSKDSFPFGSNKFHFKIYVYNIEPFSSVSISVHQPNDNGINLLRFFIIFIACFVGLLLFAVIFWKAKNFFDTFRRTRRRNVELVYMTNRPFASVPVCIEKPGHVPMKNKPSPLTSEICYGNKASVVTVLVRLPLCAQAENSSGAASLCLGSTLINWNEHQGSKMVNYMKNMKRRRNPFRSPRI